MTSLAQTVCQAHFQHCIVYANVLGGSTLPKKVSNIMTDQIGMQRISISLTAEDYALVMAALFAEQAKRGKPISLSEFVRETLRKKLQTTETE